MSASALLSQQVALLSEQVVLNSTASAEYRPCCHSRSRLQIAYHTYKSRGKKNLSWLQNSALACIPSPGPLDGGRFAFQCLAPMGWGYFSIHGSLKVCTCCIHSLTQATWAVNVSASHNTSCIPAPLPDLCRRPRKLLGQHILRKLPQNIARGAVVALDEVAAAKASHVRAELHSAPHRRGALPQNLHQNAVSGCCA